MNEKDEEEAFEQQPRFFIFIFYINNDNQGYIANQVSI